MANRISIPPLAENNLVRNNCFGEKLSFYRYAGSGSAEVISGPPLFCRFSDGALYHAFDVDNQEHADTQSVFPWQGKFVFKFRARGTGKLRAGVRWRLSYFRGDMDFMERAIEEIALEAEFKEYSLEGTVDDPHASVNDRLFWEVKEGFADVTGISLYYPEPCHEVTFNKPHIVAFPEEEISFKCENAKELLCCYGHSSNELQPEIIQAPSGEIKLPFHATGGEGMRIVGIGKSENSRHSLFVSTPPPRMINRMRNCIFDKSPRHILYFGDSLTAYDAGRNYTDIAGAFLPDSWSYTNAGIGGDDLPRLANRLKGKPRTYRLEHFEHIWDKTPDEIFLFYGANDSKAPMKTDFKIPMTPPEEEKRLWQEIFEIFQEKAPKARVTIISATQGFFPYQAERKRRLRLQDLSYTLFGLPEHIKRFNRVSREFAEEKNWHYLDFHRACAAYGDLKSLFIPDDGVHMTLTGHQLLAVSLLEYLQK